jgi:cation:H+ antiporter
MIIPGILFVLGLLCLIKGGDWFVDGASALARRFHLPELLIGATVVSVGTTLPEVMVSTISAVSGHGEIAYGNAIGSVICNTALIAAITVAVRPGKVDPKPLRVPVAFFFAAAAIYCVAAYGMGRFTRPKRPKTRRAETTSPTRLRPETLPLPILLKKFPNMSPP